VPTRPLGRHVVFMVFHAGDRMQVVRLPATPSGKVWHRVIDTSLPGGADIVDPGEEVPLHPQDAYLVNPRSTVVLLARSPSRIA
jgi:hypothetical protein